MKVLILLSTYNGDKFLVQQLNSLLAQQNVDIHILIRDDGSTDKTLSILSEYQKYSNITTFTEKNVGCASSFLKLMEYARQYPGHFDYISFCDQDDFWMPDKLSKAVSVLETMDKDKPCLYFSNLFIVDKNLENQRLLFLDSHVDISKKHALVESFCTGCTMVFNKKALDMYLSTPIGNLRIHDKRMFHLCLFLGQVYYDPYPHIKYRQHDNNVIGADAFFFQRVRNRIRSLKSLGNQHVREEDAKELLYSFSHLLNKKDIDIISEVAYYRNKITYRLNLLFGKSYQIKRKEDNFWIKLRIIIGHL